MRFALAISAEINAMQHVVIDTFKFIFVKSGFGIGGNAKLTYRNLCILLQENEHNVIFIRI